MAHYIQLVPKVNQADGSPSEPEPFYIIDAKLCEHFGVPVDSEYFYAPPGEFNWYDVIGWSCINKSLATFANELEEDGLELAKAVRWIDDNYTLISWMGR